MYPGVEAKDKSSQVPVMEFMPPHVVVLTEVMHHSPMLSPEQANFFLKKIITMFERNTDTAEVKAKHRIELGTNFAMARQICQCWVPTGQTLCFKMLSADGVQRFQ